MTIRYTNSLSSSLLLVTQLNKIGLYNNQLCVAGKRKRNWTKTTQHAHGTPQPWANIHTVV